MGSKKKTAAQRALGLAAPVMPAPVAKLVSTRWGSRLFILLLPFLFATGVLTISWNNGIPTVNFDRARAWLVGQQVGRRVEQEAVRVAQDVREQQAAAGTQQGWGQPQPASWQGQPATQQSYQQQSYQQPAYQQPAYQPQPAAQAWGPSAYR
ncbi:MAG: hypothetical protein ACKOZU_10920 [Planctomycetaceae bacterium]